MIALEHRWLRNGRVVLAVCLFVSAALAQTESIVLEYDEAPGCPSRARFEAEVRARTQKVKWGDLDGGRRFRIGFERRESGYEGTVQISAPQGEITERAISGEHCAEVASGLALVLALAVDPDASTAPVAELTIPASADTSDEPSDSPTVASPQTALPPTQSSSPPSAASRRAVSSDRDTLSAGAGLGSSVLTGPAPEALVAAALQLEVSHRAWGRAALRALAARTGTVGPTADQTEMTLLGGSLELCPLVLPLARPVEFAGCATLLGASLRAEGTAVALPGSARRAFVATGVEVGLRTYPTHGFYLDLSGAALANLTRDDFVFERPRVVVHSVPVATFALGIQLGVAIF
ncbi:MAG: hypothetical protein R3B13_32555 [Polyangiaceae bacterium]